jgi:uncharacterized protein (TIGR02265 family)
MLRLRVRIDEPIETTFDLEERLARIPREHTVKGIFFLPQLRTLGRDYRLVAPKLLAPPRLVYYVPFADYPERDCARLAFASARKLHPELPLAEACRRVGRHDAEAFANTTIGRVMLTQVRDPASNLLLLPDVYGLILSHVRCRASMLEERRVRIDFERLYGTLDNLQIGTIEGIVLQYREVPTIDVELYDEHRATFVVTW